jgi:DNA-binding HxlR family transcriptional regulator
MSKRSFDQTCPVSRTLDIVGERWTLLIIRDLLPGEMRFQDLLDILPGLAPNVLSDRLKTLEAHGLARREFYSDNPPRASYKLTDKGRELGLVVLALGRWGSRHLGGKMSKVVQHEACGHTVEVAHYCPHCQTTLAPGTTKTISRAATGRQSEAKAAPKTRTRRT